MNLRAFIWMAVASAFGSGVAYSSDEPSTATAQWRIPLQAPGGSDDFIPVEDWAEVQIADPASPFTKLTDDQVRAFGGYIYREITQADIPGSAFALVQRSRPVLIVVQGNLATGEESPVNPETLFNLGPVSQGLTSLLAAALQEEGRLSYDTPAYRLSSRFRMNDGNDGRAVNLRHLLTMTAGVPEYTDRILDPAWARPEDTFAVISQAPIVATPGRTFNYSKVSVSAAGYLLGLHATDHGGLQERFAGALERQVLGPLQMDHTALSLREATASGNYARGHEKNENGYQIAKRWETEKNPFQPAVGIKSSIMDMIQWLATEMSEGELPDGGSIAPALAVRQRWQPARTMDSRHYGMGWTRRFYQGVEIVSMSGSYDRHTTAIGFLPAHQTGWVIMMNTDSEDASRIVEELALGVAEIFRPVEELRRVPPQSSRARTSETAPFDGPGS